MQFDAIYDHGRLELPPHITLKHGRIKLSVVIPDNEIVSEPVAAPESAVVSSGTLQRLQDILGEYRDVVAGSPSLGREEIKALREQAVTEKYLGR